MSINYLHVVVAMVVGIALGMLWFSKAMFGMTWMKLSGMTEEKMKAMKAKMGKSYFFMIVGTFLMAWALANVLSFAMSFGFMGGNVMMAISVSILIWLGFMIPVSLNGVLWEGKPVKLFLLNLGHYLVSLLVMSLILVLWK